MIKRIIFDLDNTLIEWKDEYWYNAIKFACSKCNIKFDEILQEKVINAVSYYEKNEQYFNVDKMQETINKEINMNLDCSFINQILKYFEICVPEEIDISVIKTLEYLYNKYELVVLTNWFEERQKQRLKNTKIDKYFKYVYGTENIKMKPNKESFKTAMGEFAPNECVMVGDNLKIDIDGALHMGLNAVFLNRNNIIVDKKYTSITHLGELVKLL